MKHRLLIITLATVLNTPAIAGNWIPVDSHRSPPTILVDMDTILIDEDDPTKVSAWVRFIDYEKKHIVNQHKVADCVREVTYRKSIVSTDLEHNISRWGIEDFAGNDRAMPVIKGTLGGDMWEIICKKMLKGRYEFR